MVDYSRTSRLLLLVDDASTRQSVEAAADAVSCRVLNGSVAEALELLDGHRGCDAVFLGVTAQNRHVVEPLVEALGILGERRLVVAAPLELIDFATAQIWGSSILHVCDPGEAEQIEALGWALARAPERLHDSGRPASRLQQISKEVGRIANVLASLSEAETEREIGQERPIDAARIRAIIRARRLRDQYLGADLFADPAWDMLLDLMAARLEGQRVPVSSLCMAAAVPPTTALRWIKLLSEQGLFIRAADPEDGRRIYIELDDQVASALDAYLRAAQRISPIIF